MVLLESRTTEVYHFDLTAEWLHPLLLRPRGHLRVRVLAATAKMVNLCRSVDTTLVCNLDRYGLTLRNRNRLIIFEQNIFWL